MTFLLNLFDQFCLDQIISEVTELVQKYGYNAVPAKMAIEITPPVVWSKGYAAQLILNEIYGNDWEKYVKVIYMGDDTSDEDVMEVSLTY